MRSLDRSSSEGFREAFNRALSLENAERRLRTAKNKYKKLHGIEHGDGDAKAVAIFSEIVDLDTRLMECSSSFMEVCREEVEQIFLHGLPDGKGHLERVAKLVKRWFDELNRISGMIASAMQITVTLYNPNYFISRRTNDCSMTRSQPVHSLYGGLGLLSIGLL